MSGTNKETKQGLIFYPLQMMKQKSFIGIIEVVKKDSLVQYNNIVLKEVELSRHFTKSPKEARQALLALSEKALHEVEDEIIEKHKNAQKSGMSMVPFFEAAFNRYVLKQLEQTRPFLSLFKWYHQIRNPKTGNLMIAPCSFSNYKTTLHFEVTKTNGALLLVTHVLINNEQYTIDNFNRYAFLLESRNEYFFLSNQDYQTLEWIAKNNPEQYAFDAEAFVINILSKLEETYAVNRNNHFATITIEVLPINRIMLSEISNSFLVLTPQWLYDGHIIEGKWEDVTAITLQGKQYSIKRNKEAEEAFKQHLESLHPNFPKQKNGYYYLSFADAQKKQWFLKTYHHLLDDNIELLGMDMLSHFRYSSHKPVTDFDVATSNEQTLKAQFSLQFGEEIIPLQDLQKVLRAGQRAVMLKDGSLGVLSDNWLKTYATILKHSKIVGKKEFEVPKWLAITEQETTEENSHQLQLTINENWWQKWQRWQEPNSVLYKMPSSIIATLRPYQQKGFEWMKLLAEVGAGACLADDMGLGKTLQTICFVADRLEQFNYGIALIVCPSSLIYNWQKEFNQFAPHLSVYVHHGNNRNTTQISKDNCDVCITSYGTLRADIETFSNTHFEIAVIDESHNIKNPTALATRAIHSLQANCKVALSGTPVMNNTFDLYSQLSFLLPGMFGSAEFFKREYADAIDKEKNEEKTWALQKLTNPFILRRTKEQVATDLPEKTESVLWCNMSTAQKILYDEVKDQIKSNLFLNIVNDGLSKSKLAVLQGIMKLKQICSSPLLLPQHEQTTSESVKTEMLLSELKNLGNHKVLIFSQFASMLEILGTELQKAGLAYYLIDGSTPAKKRAEMVDAFQEDDNTTRIFLISLMAGNTGLTLTAADYVFLYDPWWNNAVQQQAIDRTHRIGQTKKVFAYKMICKDSIEEKILLLQQNKKALSDTLIGETEGFVKELSKEDVEFLFS